MIIIAIKPKNDSLTRKYEETCYREIQYFLEMEYGDEFSIEIKSLERCKKCLGSGSQLVKKEFPEWAEHGDMEQERCEQCEGTGYQI